MCVYIHTSKKNLSCHKPVESNTAVKRDRLPPPAPQSDAWHTFIGSLFGSFFRSSVHNAGAFDLKLAEEKYAVPLLLQPRQEFVEQHQLARVLHEVLLKKKRTNK